MSLLGLGIAAAGVYGLAMAWTEMTAEVARKKLHSIEIKEGHVDVVKHFETIVGMLEIKPIDGVLPENGYKECQDLLMLELMYVTEKDLDKFEKHYHKVRRQQIKDRKIRRKAEMKEVEEFMQRHYYGGLEGYERYDRINSYEDIKDTIIRCERLYRETPWGKAAKTPAKIIETPDGKVKEMWLMRKSLWYKEAYRKCNKVLGYNVY